MNVGIDQVQKSTERLKAFYSGEDIEGFVYIICPGDSGWVDDTASPAPAWLICDGEEWRAKASNHLVLGQYVGLKDGVPVFEWLLMPAGYRTTLDLYGQPPIAKRGSA